MLRSNKPPVVTLESPLHVGDPDTIYIAQDTAERRGEQQVLRLFSCEQFFNHHDGAASVLRGFTPISK